MRREKEWLKKNLRLAETRNGNLIIIFEKHERLDTASPPNQQSSIRLSWRKEFTTEHTEGHTRWWYLGDDVDTIFVRLFRCVKLTDRLTKRQQESKETTKSIVRYHKTLPIFFANLLQLLMKTIYGAASSWEHDILQKLSFEFIIVQGIQSQLNGLRKSWQSD